MIFKCYSCHSGFASNSAISIDKLYLCKFCYIPLLCYDCMDTVRTFSTLEDFLKKHCLEEHDSINLVD